MKSAVIVANLSWIADLQYCIITIACFSYIFQAFLGNKYGYRPLRATIAAEMFDKLCDLLENEVDSSKLHLLKDWYCKDDNAVPPVYHLQSISRKLHHYDDVEKQDLQKEARDKWWQISNVMRETLQKGAQIAVTAGVFTQDEVQVFFSSGEQSFSNTLVRSIVVKSSTTMSESKSNGI